MKTLKGLSVLLLMMWGTLLMAQSGNATIKVTDLKGKTTVVKYASSSASSSCNSPDFPAIKGGKRTDISFNDLKFITFMPYKSSSNEALYISAELEFKDGTKQEVEMSKYIRFSGKSGTDDFSITVTEVNMVEVSG